MKKRYGLLLPAALLFYISNSLPAMQKSEDPCNNINPLKNYIFYLHGRIIEEQGPDAVSPEYGSYLYRDIIQALAKSGAEVISELRPRGTDPLEYARKTANQIKSLLKAGIPPGRILVIGASKGAGIAVLLSAILGNPELKFVLLAICNKEMAAYWKKNNIRLWGKILYIYDSEDRIAGSCKPFPDILFLGSPAGIGPKIANGIREAYLEASVLGARAVFVFGHEALERKVLYQLKRKKADTTAFMTAANPGDSFQL